MTNQDLAKLCWEAAEDLYERKAALPIVGKWYRRAVAFRAMEPCKLVPLCPTERMTVAVKNGDGLRCNYSAMVAAAPEVQI